MLNHHDYINLERRLWREGNPLADELASTRDELIYLLTQAKEVTKKYSPMLSTVADADDLEYWRHWDNFMDTLDNLSYHLEGKI